MCYCYTRTHGSVEFVGRLLPPAVVILVTVDDQVRRFVELPFVLFLGDISFMLYLVHGFFISFFGYELYWHLFLASGSESIAAASSTLCVICVSAVCAPMAYHVLDRPAIALSNWVVRKPTLAKVTLM